MPLFRIRLTPPPGFKTRMGCLICATEAKVVYIPWNPPLVLHLLTSLTVNGLSTQFLIHKTWNSAILEQWENNAMLFKTWYHIANQNFATWLLPSNMRLLTRTQNHGLNLAKRAHLLTEPSGSGRLNLNYVNLNPPFHFFPVCLHWQVLDFIALPR